MLKIKKPPRSPIISATATMRMFSFFKYGSSSCVDLTGPALQYHHYRTRDEDRGVRTDRDTHHEGKGEVMNHLAAEEKKREGGHEGRERRDDGSGQNLIDAGIENGRQSLLQVLV